MTDGVDRRTFLAAAGLGALGSSLLAGCVGPLRTPGGESGGESPGSGGGPGQPMGGGPMGQHDGTGPHGPGGTGPMHGGGPTSPQGQGRGTPGRGSGGSIGDWMADVDDFAGVVVRTGTPAVTVRVGTRGNGGYFAFGPPAIRVSSGTTITWEWTGRGGAHDVTALDGGFGSGLTADAGATFGHAFDAPGVYRYYCTPHRSLGMKGVVVVR